MDKARETSFLVKHAVEMCILPATVQSAEYAQSLYSPSAYSKALFNTHAIVDRESTASCCSSTRALTKGRKRSQIRRGGRFPATELI